MNCNEHRQNEIEFCYLRSVFLTTRLNSTTLSFYLIFYSKWKSGRKTYRRIYLIPDTELNLWFRWDFCRFIWSESIEKSTESANFLVKISGCNLWLFRNWCHKHYYLLCTPAILASLQDVCTYCTFSGSYGIWIIPQPLITWFAHPDRLNDAESRPDSK